MKKYTITLSEEELNVLRECTDNMIEIASYLIRKGFNQEDSEGLYDSIYYKRLFWKLRGKFNIAIFDEEASPRIKLEKELTILSKDAYRLTNEIITDTLDDICQRYGIDTTFDTIERLGLVF